MAKRKEKHITEQELILFQERLRHIMSGESEAKFARKAGISQSGLNRILNGGLPTMDILIAIAIAGEVPIEWLITGKEERSTGDASVPSEESNHFVALPFMEVEASAGPGAAVPLYEAQQSVISFERAFLRSLGAAPEHCSVIVARGDSMMPTVPDGALVVVDHSQREIVNGWISVVNVSGDLLVKRVRRRIDGVVELASDNPIYPLETVGADMLNELMVIGRVVYFCRAP